MRDPLSKYSLRIALALLIFGLMAALAAISAYVGVFAVESGFTLSRTDQSWSNFGSYLGGVLGTMFAFLAFVAVLFTVWLQAKQLDNAKVQSHLEELQRVIASVAANVDALLAQPPGLSNEASDFRNTERTVFTILSAAGAAALRSTPDYIVEASNNNLIRISKDAILLQAGTLSIELNQLVWCLEEYLREGGSKTVSKFYVIRYTAVVCWLDALELVHLSLLLQAYFKPKESRQHLAI